MTLLTNLIRIDRTLIHLHGICVAVIPGPAPAQQVVGIVIRNGT